ncbi:hypothetical protein F5Y15DRAFT_421287 [Xylariaceae sp. FL0016]|nr:hypothetical protein F5Y15DRAFT_421287 [Xylariaceae sp. FL0016]
MASQLTPLVVAGDSGAGSRTLIGKMIWMCGLQLSQVEELSRNDIKDPAALTAFYEKNDYPLSWYARSGHHFTVQSHGASEVAIWVVDATNADGRSISSKKLASMLSDGTVKPQGRLIIAANKMDLVDWSRETFFEIANAFCSVGSPLFRSLRQLGKTSWKHQQRHVGSETFPPVIL